MSTGLFGIAAAIRQGPNLQTILDKILSLA